MDDKIEEYEPILSALGESMSDENKMIHVLNNLPKEYESLTEKLLADLGAGSAMWENKNQIVAKLKRLKCFDDEDDNEHELVDDHMKDFDGLDEIIWRCDPGWSSRSTKYENDNA